MSGAHDYQTCTDDQCGNFLCIACQFGYDLGHADGMKAGFADGFAAGCAAAGGKP